MELNHAQAHFAAGDFKEAVIEPSPKGNGWIIEFIDRHDQRVPLTTQLDKKRLFHSLDAASRMITEIGFQSARIEEPF